jgi:hypothetical protein
MLIVILLTQEERARIECFVVVFVIEDRGALKKYGSYGSTYTTSLLEIVKRRSVISSGFIIIEDKEQDQSIKELAKMSHKSYSAEEIEQYLIHQIRNNATLNNVMNESTPPNSGNRRNPNHSGLYMDEIERCSDFSTVSATPAGGNHGRHYRNIRRPIVMFMMGVLFTAAIIAIAVVVGKKNTAVAHPSWIDDAKVAEPQLTTPHVPATVDPSENEAKNKPQEDDFVEDDLDFDDEMVCVPDIKLHQELYSESIPVIASDSETIVVKHGKKLNFYEQDRTQSHAYMTLPQTHARSVNSYEPEDLTLAIHGSTSIIGDYQRDEDTGAVYVMEDNGQGERTTTQVIVAPDDVDDGGMFGFSVDIFKDRLITGAPFAYADDSGAAYIYARTDEGTWELEFIFPPPENDGPEDDFTMFGESVAIHNDRAAVSGYNEFDQVTVFIYEYDEVSDSWIEIDDVIVDKNCRNCRDVGVSVSFRDDGGLFISYPRKNEVSYLVPQNGGDYELVQKIYVDEDGDLDMDQVEVGGELMVVGVTDEFGTNVVYVYSQSNDDDNWVKVDEIELPSNENFDPDEDFIDLALSSSNLIVNYGDDKLIWYTLDGCQ